MDFAFGLNTLSALVFLVIKKYIWSGVCTSVQNPKSIDQCNFKVDQEG